MCAACLLFASLPGCGGCGQDPLAERKEEEQEKKKKREERKPDFEIGLPRTIPRAETGDAVPMAKPGHWLTVTHEVRANNFDFRAQLHTAATDTQGNPYEVENTDFRLTSSRPAALPKGQSVNLETTYFIPRAGVQEGESVWLNRELRAARGGRLVGQPDRQPLTIMPSYQYCFVVLSREPDRYGYLKRLSSVASPASDSLSGTLLYYQVLLPRIGNVAPVPSNPLTWSSVAYLLWDDVDTTTLTEDQKEAMLDWLHWGGQLIVSGPRSLAKLNGSFLAPYLPATAGETAEIPQEAVDEINEHWALPHPETGEPRTLDVPASRPLVGVRLQKHGEAHDLPHCAGLVTERRVGQGRIVVTSFALTDRALLTWGSFDSFFNACLLRRPRREFHKEDFVPHAFWPDHPHSEQDPRLSTTLRYFSRDIGHYTAGRGKGGGDKEKAFVEPEDRRPERTAQGSSIAAGPRTSTEIEESKPLPRNADHDGWQFKGYPPRETFGMAAWNDRSGASDTAREALKDAAGISIPRGKFVLQVLAVYLLVLAPLNWGFFRLIGRVEWAWVAAPVIAIVGAFAVVRLAQLDIGFARSVTEVGIAEMQGEYPRAHLTRYAALYTSLSTGYDIEFDDPAAAAQPFGAATNYVRSGHDPVYTVRMDRERKLRLTGFRVPSNKTGIVHTEQMSDMGGVFRLSGDEQEGLQCENRTDFSLEGAGVLRKTEQGQIEGAWIGNFDSNSATALQFVDLAGDVPHFAQWERSFTTLSYQLQADNLLEQYDEDGDGNLDRGEVRAASELSGHFGRLDLDRDGHWDPHELIRWCRKSRAGEVSLGQLVELASQGLNFRPGEYRLIGWTREAMPGMAILPSAAQTVQRTLFLVHLKRGDLPPPRPDNNAKADVMETPFMDEDAVDEDAVDEDAVDGDAMDGEDGEEVIDPGSLGIEPGQ